MKPLDSSATPHSRVYAALLELVECKDLKDSTEADFYADEPMLTTDQRNECRAEYERRKPLAWEAARKVLTECVPSEKGEQEGYPGIAHALEAMRVALQDIASGPQLIEDYKYGIRCGVEDRGLQLDPYRAAEYGYEKGLDWCADIAESALKNAAPSSTAQGKR